jgi:hypothetical protein
MHTTMLYTAAVFAVAVALIHSILGERRLIGPILDEVPPGPKILKGPLARKILRFAWHITSLSWIAQAAIFVIVATMPPGAQSRPIVAVIGVSFLLMAGVSIVISRGRHVGWPVLAAVGVAALAAVVVGN